MLFLDVIFFKPRCYNYLLPGNDKSHYRFSFKLGFNNSHPSRSFCFSPLNETKWSLEEYKIGKYHSSFILYIQNYTKFFLILTKRTFFFISFYSYCINFECSRRSYDNGCTVFTFKNLVLIKWKNVIYFYFICCRECGLCYGIFNSKFNY